MAVSTRGVSQYRSGQTHRAMWKRTLRAGVAKGVLACPGWTGTADHWFEDGTDQLDLIAPIVEAGFPVASRAEGQQWGNAESRAQFTDLRTYAQSHLSFASGKVHVLGISAGSLAAMSWAMANPTLVRSLSLLLPCVDPQDVYDRDPFSVGLRASISAAYGARPADSDVPALNTANFAGIPIKMWYSPNDPICLPDLATAFATATAATAVSLGTQSGGFTPGHSINGLDPDAISTWIAAN